MGSNVFVLSQNLCDVWFAGQNDGTKTVKTPEEWCIAEKADLVFNLGLFDLKTGESVCYVKGPRMISDSSGATSSTIGGKSKILTINSQNQCKGYSNGIVDGKISFNTNALLGSSRTRNGIGITTTGEVIIAQTDTPYTERAYCEEVNSKVINRYKKAVKLFVLEDGGQSTQEYSDKSKRKFAPERGRKVATVVCVRFKIKPIIDHVIHNGLKDPDVEFTQIFLGGLDPDGSCGPASVKAITEFQKLMGFPKALQCGIASAKTLRALGLSPAI